MAKIESKNKQNPKLLQQSELKDGHASLYLEFYLGRSETPVLDEDGNQLLYTSGAMAGKPKYRIKHIRKRENLNLYVWLYRGHPLWKLHNGLSKAVYCDCNVSYPLMKSNIESSYNHLFSIDDVNTMSEV